MLNEFVNSHSKDSKPFLFSEIKDTSYYNPVNKIIYLQPSFFNSLQQHQAVTTLVYEVTHTLSQIIIEKSSVTAYAESRGKLEGEAIYNEFIALHKIYAS